MVWLLFFVRLAVLIMLWAPAVVFAQNGRFDLDELLQTGKPEEIQEKVRMQISKNKGTALGLYLEAFLTGDAALASETYQKLLRSYPDSDWADDALLKIAQYYFSRGLYVSARRHFLQLIEAYPSSDHVAEAMYFAAACLYAAGKYQSCYIELNNFMVQSRNSPLRLLAQEDLRELQQKLGRAKIESPASKRDGRYALQLGAFSNETNAKRVKDYCEKLGLPVEIHERENNGEMMYLVWMGSFGDEREALRFGEKFKSEHGKPYRVVER